MKRKDYCANQSGAAMSVFVGARYQRGHGLGRMLSGLIRHVVVPFLKRNSGALAGNVLKTVYRSWMTWCVVRHSKSQFKGGCLKL